MSGNVTDSRSHQPVEGAKVTVVGNKANPEITDRDGNFILTFSASTREGEVVRVRIEKTGYKVYEIHKPVSPTMPLQFSIDRIAPTAPPRRTSRESTSTHPLPPLIKEEIWSVLIPFNEGDGDPIPAFRMTQADVEKFPSLGLFYKRISDWSKSALEGRDRPHTPEAINSFLEEIVRYHVFEWVDQLQHDRYSQSWDYRTGAKSNAILANAPPDFVEYPRSKVIGLISNTPLGSVRDVMTYWRSRIDSFRIPANSTLQFLTNPENGADTYRIQISNPSVFTLTLSVLHGMTLLNYGFVPPQFELTPETIKHTRSYDIVVKGRLEFKRFSDTDPLLQDEYVKWAVDLFAGLRKSMVAETGPPTLPEPATQLAPGASTGERKASGRSPVVENTRKLAVMIPFDTAPKSAPIPLDENPDDPLFRTYLRFQSLATNGTVPADIRNAEEQGQISWEARPVSTNEAPSFLAQMLRYYVFYTIDSLQRDSLTVSVGYPAQARAGIEPPDAEPYLYDRLSKDIGENAFFKPFRHRLSGDEMTWRTKPVRMPKGTEIQFLQDSDSYVVCLRRPDHYRADFSVKVFAGTGLGSVPKYFSTSHISTTMQWTFILTMHYSIEQPEDTNFNPTAYAEWLDSLFDGLRKQLTLE